MELALAFHGPFWTTFEQHLWFIGNLWDVSNLLRILNFVQIENTMGFHETLFILPSSTEFHIIPWNLWFFQKILWIPWNLFMVPHSTKRYKFHNKKNLVSIYCSSYLADDNVINAPGNTAHCMDFNIITFILGAPVSAKMGNDQRKREAVLNEFSWFVVTYQDYS